MYSVEEKLAVFSGFLLEQQQKEAEKLIRSAEAQRDEKIRSAEQALEKEKQAIEDHSYQNIFRDTNRAIAAGKSSAKEMRLFQEKAIRDDFEHTLIAKAEDYIAGSPLYLSYLQRCSEKLFELFPGVAQLMVSCRPQDRDRIRSFVDPSIELVFEDSDQEVIGGMIVRDGSNRFSCDFSVAALIRDHEAEISLALGRLMKGEGDRDAN